MPKLMNNHSNNEASNATTMGIITILNIMTTHIGRIATMDSAELKKARAIEILHSRFMVLIMPSILAR
jgi:hypothetical protein